MPAPRNVTGLRYLMSMAAPNTRDELIAAMREARVAQGLSLRAVARQANLPASTLQGWFEGRHLPTPQLQDHFIGLLRLLRLLDDESVGEWIAALDRLRSGGEIGPNPYPGIRPFTADDAPLYFGRERILDELVAAVRRADGGPLPKLVAVVGLSGSGKTSLLRAGLVGRECSHQGRLSQFEPVQLAVHDLPSWQPPADGSVLLVVDDLERLRNLSAGEREAAVAALASMPSNVTAVFAVVADSFEFVLEHDQLRRPLSSPVLLGSLDDNEFADIVTRPAEANGRRIEESLVALIIRDLHRYGEPSAQVLPLLSNALFRAWENTTGEVVGVQDFLATGGIWGGLERLADGLYGEASPDEQQRIRSLFLSLVQVNSDGIERRVVELASVPEELLGVVESYLGARLLTVTEHSLMISHSALLGRWARLGMWVEEEREQLLFRRRISKAAEVWEESRRDPQALIPVEALVFDRFARDTGIALTPLERDFFDASVARAEETTQAQRKEVRSLRRRNALTSVLALLAVAGLVVALVMVGQSRRFQRSADEARSEAQSRQLALIAEELRGTDRNLAAQLSLAAIRTADTLEAQAAVLKSAGLQTPRRVTGAPGTVRLDVDDANSVLVKAAADGTVTGWAPSGEGSPRFTFKASDGQLFGIAVGQHRGRTLVAVTGQQTASVWDVTADPVRLGEFGADAVGYSASIGPTYAFFGMLDGTIQRVNLRTMAEGEPIVTGSGLAVDGLAAHPNADLVVSSRGAEVVVWGASGEQLDAYDMGRRVTAAAFAPDGATVAATAGGGRAALIGVGADGVLGSVERIQFGAVTLHGLAYDGRRLLVGAWDGRVGVFDHNGQPLGEVGEGSTVTGLAIAGDHLAIGTIDGSALFWPRRYAGLLIEGSATDLPTAMSGSHIVKYKQDRAVVHHIDGSEEHTVAFVEDAGSGFGHAIVSDHVVSLPTASGRLASWDAEGPEDAPPVWSQVAESNASALEAGPENLAVYAESGRDYVTVIRRAGLEWSRVARVEAWSTLALGWHPEQPLLAAMSVDSRRLVIHDLDTGQPVVVGQVELPRRGAAIELVWTADGHITVGTDAGTLIRIDATNPASPSLDDAQIELSSGVSALAVTPDGKLMAAGFLDGRIYVWRTEGDDFAVEALLRPGAGAISALQFYDEEIVFITDTAGAYAWPLDVEQAATDLCDAVGDPITAEEWGRLVPGVPLVDACPA